MDIHELFEAAGNLHGHLCPGLAVGVRAAAEAGGLLHGELRCAIESRACWADGFQSVLGATVGSRDRLVRHRPYAVPRRSAAPR